MTDFSNNQSPIPTQLMTYSGHASHIFGIWLKSFFLNIITLTIYRAWAKVRMRKYLWSHITIDGDALRYTGTGGEVFRGFVKLALILTVLSLLTTWIVLQMHQTKPEDLSLVEGTTNEQIYAVMEGCGYTHANWHEVTQEVYNECMTQSGLMLDEMQLGLETIVYGLLFSYFYFFARYASLRYRLSRTSWRGIRGRMTGSAHHYARLSFWRIIINIVTLGLLIPKSQMVTHQCLIKDLHLGSQNVHITTDTKGLFKTHLITMILSIPTLGLSRFWYYAALKNKKLENMSIGNLRFAGEYTGGGLLSFYIVNILLIVFTLGIASPFIIQRTLKFHTSYIVMIGTIDSSGILQAEATGNAISEGLADEFDTGFDVDFGFI